MMQLSAQLPLGTLARDNPCDMSEPAQPSPHTHRVTFLIAIVGVLLAGYSLWRADISRDRADAARERITQAEAAQAGIRNELAAIEDRDSKARAEMQRQWQTLAELPQQVRDLTAAQEDLRARTERPQRTWTRAEAMYLIELAQRRLSFDHDIATAISALESADMRLASLHDSSLNGVRERIATDLRALRAIHEPDRSGIVARLLAIEGQLDQLQLKGILVGQRTPAPDVAAPTSIFARAWRMIIGAFDRMFTVRRVDAEHSDIVALEEQALRRQHLTLLVYSARSAAIRVDQVAYNAAISEAQAWLARYFDGGSAQDLGNELAALKQINIAPTLPDISAAAQSLGRPSSVSQNGP
jgi:uroporphyrin-3 C-methyltransferase